MGKLLLTTLSTEVHRTLGRPERTLLRKDSVLVLGEIQHFPDGRPEELGCSVGLGIAIPQERIFGFIAKPGIFLWAAVKQHLQVGWAAC